MNLALFYRGLMYALAERRTEFVAEGDPFHSAFREMLQHARTKGLPIPADELLEDFDPMFGVSPHASDMIFEAERDFVLSLMNPRLKRAQFKIKPDAAKQALDRLDDAPVFRELAEQLDAHLPQPS